MKAGAAKKAVCRETPTNGLSLAPAFSNAVMRLQARVDSDPEFLPLLIAETRMAGSRAALLADAFEEVLGARRAARLARRDAALVEASGFYSGSPRKIGEQLAADLRRYEQNDWRRKDCRLDAYPERPFRTPAVRRARAAVAKSLTR